MNRIDEPGVSFLQVLAVSKPVKLTYNSWGKPAKRPSTCPDRPATRRPLSEAFDATAAATAAAAATARWTAATAGKAGGPGERPEMVRRLLQRGDLSHAGNFKGQQVEVFWPQDATWWLARIIKVCSPSKHLFYATLSLLPTVWLARVGCHLFEIRFAV